MEVQAAAYVDPLFEFDAPQRFVDLAAAVARRHDARARCAWFDAPHDAHARPSAELARALAARLERQARPKQQPQQKQQQAKKKEDKQAEQRSPGSEKENRDERARGRWAPRSNRKIKNQTAADGGGRARRFEALREAREKQRPFEAARARAAEAKRLSVSPEAAAKRPAERARRPLGSLGNDRQKHQQQLPKHKLEQQPKQQLQKLRRAKRTRADAGSEMSDELKELLARHNRKIKAARHTYEPPRHTVRQVRMVRRRKLSRIEAGDELKLGF